MIDNPLVDFLARYRAFTTDLHLARYHAFCRGFEHLRSTISPLQAQALEHNRILAPRFNLFKLLGVAHSEVKTHSAMLAELLSPTGYHAQGLLFLRHFLTMCHSRHPSFPLPIQLLDGASWRVETEKVTSHGNLDIVIACPTLGYRIVIENKIWANEQIDQLARYWEWMHQDEDLYTQQALIFLTPGGWPARSDGGSPYYRLSYRRDIVDWLRLCIDAVAAPRVQQTILQYLEVVEVLDVR